MSVILAIVALGAILVISLLAMSRSQGRQISGLADFESRWQKVDMEAFSNLIDPQEQRYLQRNLPAAEFRKLQRERVTIMWEYLSRLAENSKLMVQAGQIVQHSSTGEVAVKAQQLVSNAIRTRMLILMAEAYLVVKFVMPDATDPIQPLVRRYENLSLTFAQTWTQHNLATVASVAS
ncbi:MAG: hypothetical protein JWO13_2957 [Acidobacteriales bacterium]|nr:hypothetical protein [Terriglobales bacterium]